MKLRQRPHKSPVGVKFKFSDEYSLPSHMGAPPDFYGAANRTNRSVWP